MDRIQIRSSVKRVYLDDRDDYIELNFNDSTLPSRFYAMVDRIQNRIQEEDEKHKNTGDGDVKGILNAFSEIQKPIGEEIDAFFGKDTCMKIWGCNHPACDVCMYFLEQISPIFEKYASEFTNRISK